MNTCGHRSTNATNGKSLKLSNFLMFVPETLYSTREQSLETLAILFSVLAAICCRCNQEYAPSECALHDISPVQAIRSGTELSLQKCSLPAKSCTPRIAKIVITRSTMKSTLLISLRDKEMLWATSSMLGDRATTRTSRTSRNARRIFAACTLYHPLFDSRMVSHVRDQAPGVNCLSHMSQFSPMCTCPHPAHPILKSQAWGCSLQTHIAALPAHRHCVW
jgi:hypothetical protein